MNTYDIGDTVRLTASFSNSSGTPANPSGGVTLSITNPLGAVSAPSPTSSGGGVYYYDFAITMSGTHFYRWVGTGDIPVAGQGGLIVRTLNQI